jgi:hypothetical protein
MRRHGPSLVGSGSGSDGLVLAELVFKGAGVALENDAASFANVLGVGLGVAAAEALAARTAGRARGEALAVQLEALGLLARASATRRRGCLLCGA